MNMMNMVSAMMLSNDLNNIKGANKVKNQAMLRAMFPASQSAMGSIIANKMLSDGVKDVIKKNASNAVIIEQIPSGKDSDLSSSTQPSPSTDLLSEILMKHGDQINQLVGVFLTSALSTVNANQNQGAQPPESVVVPPSSDQPNASSDTAAEVSLGETNSGGERSQNTAITLPCPTSLADNLSTFFTALKEDADIDIAGLLKAWAARSEAQAEAMQNFLSKGKK